MTLSVINTSVNQAWAGALTSTGFRVQADLATANNNGVQSNIVVTTAADTGFANPVFRSTPAALTKTTSATSNPDFFSAKYTVTGLTPNTSYRWAVESNGSRRSGTTDASATGAGVAAGLVKTAPTQGTPASFSFAFGACSRFASDLDGTHVIHNTTCQSLENIAAESNCLFFLHAGDLIYDDYTGAITGKRSNARFVRAFRGSPSAQTLCAAMPIAYTWSNHDCVSTDQTVSDSGYSTQAGISATVYQELVPHYDLGDTATLGIAQSWWIGSCFFVMPDCYTFRDTAGSPPPMLGSTQKTWVVDQVTSAIASGATMIFLVSSPTWTTATTFLSWKRTWATEQTALLDALRALPGLPGIVILEGDNHSFGADDGGKTDYSTGGGMKIIRISSSGLKQTSMIGEGPGCTWNGSNTLNTSNTRGYCRIDVNSTGNGIVATFKGRASGDGSFSTIGTYSTVDISGWGV